MSAIKKKQKTEDLKMHSSKLYQITSCFDEGISHAMVIKAYSKLQIANEMLLKPRKFSRFMKNILELNDYMKATPEQLLKGIDNTEKDEYLIKLTEVPVKIIDNTDSQIYGLIKLSVPKYRNIYYAQHDGIEIIAVNKPENIVDYILELIKTDKEAKNIVQDTITWHINKQQKLENYKLDINDITHDNIQEYKEIIHQAITKKPRFSPIINDRYEPYRCLYFIINYNVKLSDLVDNNRLVILSSRTNYNFPLSVIIHKKSRIQAATEILAQVNKIDLNNFYNNRNEEATPGEIFHKILSSNSYVGLYVFTPEALLKRIGETKLDGDSSAAVRINKLDIDMDITITE